MAYCNWNGYGSECLLEDLHEAQKCMTLETSAVGRSLAMLGIEVSKRSIASREEVAT
jgi:hypothetical protein